MAHAKSKQVGELLQVLSPADTGMLEDPLGTSLQRFA